jgi:hypothetical protein
MNQPGEGERKPEVHFLEVPGGTEPSDALLSRLSAAGPPVKRRSKCTLASDGTPLDSDTGAPGAIIGIEKSKRRDEGGIEVQVIRRAGPLNAEGDTLILQRKAGSWDVRKASLRWIS